LNPDRRQENRFLVFTDIIGHTKMFARVGPSFRAMREKHDALFLDAVRQLDPKAIVKGTGDGFYAGFEQIAPAIECALAFRRGLASTDWSAFVPPDKRTPDNVIKCRIGVHCGSVNIIGSGSDIDGQPRSTGEKLMGMAGANQILVSRPVRDAARGSLGERTDLSWQKFGEYKLRDVPDCIEVWGLGIATGGNDDFAPGARPIQPPEHRVIVFATIDDYTTNVEQLGPRFMSQKDAWDAEFAKAASTHAKDAFIKRLPDGTLAAFKSAVEAIRVARDFRRGLKAAKLGERCLLQTRTAVESGLVTFEYENNQPIDVRDQPVNIPAKMVKTGLVGTGQLMMTRPVREDAWANLPEREEFKWVCLGRKPIPGEPEPIEIWEFCDVQTRAETRAVVCIDARDAKRAIGSSTENAAKFDGKLGAIVVQALAGRSEEPWMLPVDSGMALAFKDPVEAALVARKVAADAQSEHWERAVPGFSRPSKHDNLLRIALNLGQLSVTMEDGVLRSFKGSGIDAARPLIESARSGQVVLSREMRDAVAAGFSESEVVFRKFEGQGATQVDAFEMVAPSKSRGPLLIGAGVGLVAVAGIAIALSGVLSPKPVNPGRGDNPSNVSGAGWKPGEKLPPAVEEVFRGAEQDIDLQGILSEIRQTMLAYDAAAAKAGKSEDARGTELTAVGRQLKPLAQSWGDKYDSTIVINEHAPKLKDIKDLEGLSAWLTGTKEYEKLPNDPRRVGAWQQRVDELKKRLEKVSVSDSAVSAQLERASTEIDAVSKLAWIKRDQATVKSRAEALDKLLATDGELDKQVAALVAGKAQRQAAELETIKAINAKLDTPPATGAEWAALNAAWKDAAVAIGKQRDSADAAALAALSQRVTRAHAQLAQIPSVMPITLDAPQPGWKRDLREELSRRRESAAQTIAGQVLTGQGLDDSAFATALKQASTPLAALSQQVTSAATALASIESSLDNAFGLDAPVNGGSVSSVASSVASSPLAKDPAFAEALGSVLSRVDALREVAKATSADQLRQLATSAKRTSPEVAPACWSRLSEPAMLADPAWLDAQTDVLRELTTLTAIKDESRRKQIESSAKAELPTRWLAYVSTLNDEPNLKRALAKRVDFGVSEPDLLKLPAQARYNLKLLAIKDAARAPESPEAEEALKRLIAGFTTGEAMAVTDKPAAASLAGQLRDPLASAKAAAPAFDPNKVDPKLIGPALAGWKFVGQSGNAYRYEMEGDPLKGQPVRLDFVRLNVPEQTGPQSVVFLSTTEVSLRHVIELVDKNKGWSKLQSAYTKQPDRRGPIVWGWPQSSREKPMDLIDDLVNGQRSWVGAAAVLQSKSYYPADVRPGEPTLDMPMNYVTPPAAGFIARLANCRLPSSAEFRAALAVDGGPSADGWNLRDQTFRKVAEHFARELLTGLSAPDAQSFARPGTDKRAYDFDDGTVWFNEVSSDAMGRNRTFHHLIGNVAELVFEKPELFEGMRIGVYDDVANVLDKPENADSVMVIGGSALSARVEPDALAKPVSVKSLRKRMFENGCSDVGFRLAFSPAATGTPETYTQAVLRLVENAPLLGK
jgi:hypothetical protein